MPRCCRPEDRTVKVLVVSLRVAARLQQLLGEGDVGLAGDVQQDGATVLVRLNKNGLLAGDAGDCDWLLKRLWVLLVGLKELQ